MVMRVFVYGTLKTGKPNHGLLKGSIYFGDAVTEDLYTMYNVGFPYLSTDQFDPKPVMGEVYLIEDDVEEALDRLEGVDVGHYLKRFIRVEFLRDGDGCDCLVYLVEEGMEDYEVNETIVTVNRKETYSWET